MRPTAGICLQVRTKLSLTLKVILIDGGVNHKLVFFKKFYIPDTLCLHSVRARHMLNRFVNDVVQSR